MSLHPLPFSLMCGPRYLHEKVHLLFVHSILRQHPSYMSLTAHKSEPDMAKALPPIPERDVPSNLEYYNPERFSHLDPSQPVERSRIPLIVLAQQQQGYNVPDPEEYESPPRQWRLSTITEKSERTEFTPRWAHSQQLMTPSRGLAPSSLSSYGEIIGGAEFS